MLVRIGFVRWVKAGRSADVRAGGQLYTAIGFATDRRMEL
jgi:hypothetical protein